VHPRCKDGQANSDHFLNTNKLSKERAISNIHWPIDLLGTSGAYKPFEQLFFIYFCSHIFTFHNGDGVDNNPLFELDFRKLDFMSN
jgi:hypothetical protein